MTVNIIISGESGGNSLADSIDLGKVDGNGESNFQDLFIRHDANIASITDCSFYVTRFTGTGYLGSDEDADYADVLSWGDAGDGGFVLNQVPQSTWSIGQQFSETNDQVITPDFGTINNQIELKKDSIVTGSVPSNDGEIPVNGQAHIQARVIVPDTVASAGYRAIELVMAYSATS